MFNNQTTTKDFIIADLCIVTELNHMNDYKITSCHYQPIESKVFYHKNNKYTDIDTNIVYTTSYEKIGDKFIDIGSIIPFNIFLKERKIQLKNKTLTRTKAKNIYNEYK